MGKPSGGGKTTVYINPHDSEPGFIIHVNESRQNKFP